MRTCRFGAKKGPIAPKIFFQKNHWYNFHVPLDPFYCKKLQKKPLELIQSYNETSFLGPKWPICTVKPFFFRKTIDIIFMYLLALLTVQNFKKSLELSQSYSNTLIVGPKVTRFPWTNFFPRKIINVISIHFLASLIVQNKKKILRGDP